MGNRSNNSRNLFLIQFFIILFLGLTLRLPGLVQRPMHTDEAVHAIKFASLLEENRYRYDPHEYHGPTLNVLTLIPAWLSSAEKITEVNETTLRIVPAFFGMLLILGLFLLKAELSKPFMIMAGLFTAVSPAMVFYSRYYIQEMLLVSFTFWAIVSGFRFFRTKKVAWAIMTGLFLGCMHATKETSVLAFGAMILALCLTRMLHMQQRSFPSPSNNRIRSWHILLILVSALIVSTTFYSSFFSHPRGILDSFLTYKTYLHRAGHKVWHIHPWFFYFKLLIGSRQGGTPLWSEGFILLLALISFLTLMGRKHKESPGIHLLRFVSFYTVIMTIVYASIPYKTPWSMLGFYHGLILMAASGACFLLNLKSNKWIYGFLIFFIISGVVHLVIQSNLSNFKYHSDPANPYVYAHPTPDVYKIRDRIHEVADTHPDGKELYIEVICSGDDYWPLPWYFRSFPNIGWWNHVDFSVPAAPVILASPDMESDILEKLYGLPPPGEKALYVPLFDSHTELRPQIEIRGYILKELWDNIQRQ